MSMKPILFNTEMVKAILDGRKTVTRRIIKPQPEQETQVPLGYVSFTNHSEHDGCFAWGLDQYGGKISYARPLCYKDDILYVRETWSMDFNGNKFYRATDKLPSCEYCYEYGEGDEDTHFYLKWHPSIHMPKEAARIFLRVMSVRVEQLQDMGHDAPAKEGIRGYTKDGDLYKFAVSDDWWMDYHRAHKKKFRGTYWQDMPLNPTIAFSYLWNSTIPKKDPGDMYKYGWDANPWVWVYEFERISKEEAYE